MIIKISAPVLLIAFNRPDTTKQVFQKIREAQPAFLFVAVDGPRPNKIGEAELVENVKQIVNQIDWECKVDYKYNEMNLGAEITVSNAVSWALEKNEYVIILEDDIIAPLSFFVFAQQMLEKYANNEKIFMISSNQPTPVDLPNGEDYLFCTYGHTWGWATWKRAWEKYDLYVDDFNEYLYGDAINSLVNSSLEKKYWRKIIYNMKKRGGGNNTWDYCWLYIRLINKGLSIVPKTNLSSNIGIYGLHSRGQNKYHFWSYDEKFLANNHPSEVSHNLEYDKHHFKTHIYHKTPFIKRVVRKIVRLF